MIVMTADRMFAIKFPYAYERKSKVVVPILIPAGFLISVTLMIIQLSTDINYKLKLQSWAHLGLVFFNIIFLSVGNSFLFFVTHTHIRSIEMQQVAIDVQNSRAEMNIIEEGVVIVNESQNTSPNGSSDSTQPISKRKTKLSAPKEKKWTRSSQSIRREARKAILNKEIKAAYICIRMVASFTILWLPWSIERIFYLSDGEGNKTWRTVGKFLATLNSVVDPILYIMFNRTLRQQIWKKSSMKKVFRRKKTTKDESGTNTKLTPVHSPHVIENGNITNERPQL